MCIIVDHETTRMKLRKDQDIHFSLSRIYYIPHKVMKLSHP